MMKSTKPIFIFSIVTVLILLAITLNSFNNTKAEDVAYGALTSENYRLNEIQHNTTYLTLQSKIGGDTAAATLDVDSIATQLRRDASSLKRVSNSQRNYNEVGNHVLTLYGYYFKNQLLFSESTADTTQEIYDLNRKIFASTTKAIIDNNNSLQKIVTIREQRDKVLVAVIGVFSLILVCLYLAGLYISSHYKIEAANRVETERYNSFLLQNIYDPIIVLDANRKITSWNKYAEELYGFKEAEVVGRLSADVLKTEFPYSTTEEVEESFKLTRQWRGEMVHHTKTGDAIPVALTRSAMQNKKGNITGYISVVRDISGHKEMETKLLSLSENLQTEVRKKSGELQVVFERVRDAFIALDNDLNYTYLNKKALEMHNLPLTEIIGKNITDILDGVANETFYSSLVEAIKTQEAIRVESYSVKEEKWYENLIYPGEDGISIYYRDTTASKKAAQNLNISNERLKSHFENTPMGVIECGSEDEILLWNKRAEEIFNISASNALGKKIADLPVFYGNPLFVSTETDSKTNESVFYADLTSEDGIGCHCKFYNSHLYDIEGNRIGQLYLIQDITESKKIEEDLKEAEQMFRNLVEESMVGVYIIQDEVMVYANPICCSIFGYTEEEFAKIADFSKIVYGPDISIVRENVEARISGEKRSLHYEFRGIKKDGEQIMVEVFGNLTQFKGKPAIIGSILDITSRVQYIKLLKDNETDLRLSNERFQLAAQATLDAVWDWNMQNGTIWGNEHFCNFMGVEEVGSDDLMAFFEKIHPDDRKGVHDNFMNALQSKTSMVEAECRVINNDNKYSLISDKSYIIYGDNGRAVRVVGAFQDITEKREDQKRILREKQLSDSIINSLPTIFLITDEKGRFRRWNKTFENFIGLDAKEISKQNVLKIFHEDDWQRVENIRDNVMEKGYAEEEIMLLDRNNEARPFFIISRPLIYEGDDCVIGVGIDISERIKYETQLKLSEGKYRSLIQQAPDGIFICGEKGIFSNINESIASLSGFEEVDILRMSVDEIFILEEGNLLQVLTSLKEGQGTVTEGYIKQKDGNLLSVEISFQALSNGFYQGIARNVTARKQAEMELIISESKYRLLFNKNPLPLFIINTTTQEFLDVNNAAQEFYEYSKKELLKSSLHSLSKHNSVKKLSIINVGILKNDLTNGKIHKHYTKSGKQVFVKIDSHDIMYENQSATLLVAIDETEKLAAQETLQQSHASLRQLALHLEHIREAERTHMAREIHDELGQQLTGLKMDVSWVSKKLEGELNLVPVKQRLKDVVGLINETVITVRRLATKLRPSILDDLGLVAALEWQTEEFEKRAEIVATFTTDVTNVELDKAVITNIFRIYQESLTNVSRHAEATEVHSRLMREEDSLALEIKDNGKGFNISSIESKKTLGLLGMNERVLLIGGQYHIYSSPGKGTLIRITIPLLLDVTT